MRITNGRLSSGISSGWLLDAHVRDQQRGLDLFQQAGVDCLAAQYQVDDAFGQGMAGTGQAFPQTAEQSGLLRFVGRGRCLVFAEPEHGMNCLCRNGKFSAGYPIIPYPSGLTIDNFRSH
jgi:hypothetical protein